MNDGSFSSGSEPCLLAPSSLTDMQVLTENAEKIITTCHLHKVCEALDFLVDSSCRVESSRVHAECTGSAEGYVQVYGLFCIFRLVCTAAAEEGRWVCTCVSTANWIMTADR